jgi:hypothetical protein
MTESLHDIEALMEGLKQQRDAIKVQLHLGKAEALQEWEELEKKLEHLRAKAAVVGAETQAASRDVFEAVKLLAEEIGRGYERIRKRL